MFEKIRILPVVIITASLLFGLKLEDIWRNAGNLDFAPALAQTDSTDSKVEKSAAQPGVDSQSEKSKQMAAKQPAPESTAADDSATGRTKPINVHNLTSSEIQLLQSLAKRRDEMDRRAQEMNMREAILNATEKRIDSKIEELKALEARVQQLIKKHDQEAEDRLKSLVKVYESMKPKDAARIFEALEMEILIDVSARMKEAKMAAVLAKMNSEKARELTVRLANLKVLPENGG